MTVAPADFGLFRAGLRSRPISADEEIFFDDFYNNSSISVHFEGSVRKRDVGDASDDWDDSSVTQIFGANQIDIGRRGRRRVDDDTVDDADNVDDAGGFVETVVGVQVLKPVESRNKKSNKKSIVFTNQSIALNVATGKNLNKLDRFQ